MKNFLRTTGLLISLFFLLPGCGTMAPVVEKDTQVQYRDRWHTQADSVFVYVADSVMIREKGDTVYIDRWRFRYRDRYRDRTDSLYIRDSIYREVPVLVEKRLNGWQDFQLWIGRLALAVLAVLLGCRLLKRYLKPF